ncbi:MAG: hypothetical protein AAGG51_22725 [Cyanobacteria bacterium P01_G01_bin.54]
MAAPYELIPRDVSTLFANAIATGVLTIADRCGLRLALLNDNGMGLEDHQAINRLLRSVRRGRITLAEF